MDEILYQHISRLIFVITVISALLIGQNALECYKSLTVQEYTEDFLDEISICVFSDSAESITIKQIRNATEFLALKNKCKKFGYEAQITITRAINDVENGYTVTDVYSNDYLSNNFDSFSITQGDFICVKIIDKNDRTFYKCKNVR